MKNIFCLIVFIITNAAWASESCTESSTTLKVDEVNEIKTDVPKFLEGATIIVRLKDGRETTVPAEKYKVVPRKQQFVVTKVTVDKLKTCSAANKNRLSVLAGKGPKNDLTHSESNGTVYVENKFGTTVGLQYQRELDVKLFGMPVSVGGQVQDNSTGLGVIGVDF